LLGAWRTRGLFRGLEREAKLVTFSPPNLAE
jgi:hypothetical protein